MAVGAEFVKRHFPKGKYWTPLPGGNFDKLLGVIGQAYDDQLAVMKSLADMDDPLTANRDLLPEYCDSYGVAKSGLTEDTQISQIRALKFMRQRRCFVQDLQQALEMNGFEGVYVTPNSPEAVKPGYMRPADMSIDFMKSTADPQPDNSHPTQAKTTDDPQPDGSGPIYAKSFMPSPAEGYFVLNGSDNMNQFCANCDDFQEIQRKYWGLIFFVSGEVDRDPVTNIITNIHPVTLPDDRRADLHALIAKYKPIHSWACCFIHWETEAAAQGDAV